MAITKPNAPQTAYLTLPRSLYFLNKKVPHHENKIISAKSAYPKMKPGLLRPSVVTIKIEPTTYQNSHIKNLLVITQVCPKGADLL